MANIFHIDDNARLIRRIESLTPETKPLWGTMSVSQMLEHCHKPLDVADGSLPLKRGLIGFCVWQNRKSRFFETRRIQEEPADSAKFQDSAYSRF